MPRALTAVVIWAILVPAWIGCGQQGPQRFPVRGTVTFRGQPVPKGAIFFEPTLSASKEAPTVYLAITDGRFEVSAKDGPGKGRYSVVVAGWDPANEFVDDDGVTHSVPLFQDYRFEVDFPVPQNTLNVEVPDSQAVGGKASS